MKKIFLLSMCAAIFLGLTGCQTTPLTPSEIKAKKAEEAAEARAERAEERAEKRAEKRDRGRSPGRGWVWVEHPSYGWGWHHSRRGWYNHGWGSLPYIRHPYVPRPYIPLPYIPHRRW